MGEQCSSDSASEVDDAIAISENFVPLYVTCLSKQTAFKYFTSKRIFASQNKQKGALQI